MKFCIAIVIAALIFSVLALGDLDARAGGKSRAETTVSFRPLRAYNPATNAFTSETYFIRTADGPGCTAVLSVNAGSVATINALGLKDGLHTWSGSRRDFSASGLPNPCP